MKYYFFFQGNLSQWSYSPFIDPKTSINFVNCEQWMMWNKALLFKDHTTASRILSETSPRIHKQLGRLVKNFDSDVWQDNDEEIVLEGNYLKFTQNLVHKQELMSIGKNTMPVEASPYDTKWGIGMSLTDPNRFEESKWRGQNKLGKVLFRVKEKLFSEIN